MPKQNRKVQLRWRYICFLFDSKSVFILTNYFFSIVSP